MLLRTQITYMDKKQFNKMKRDYGPRINEKILIPQIRVINEDGKMLGIMSPKEALAIAKQYGLDLVEVVANARPPVCKIIDTSTLPSSINGNHSGKVSFKTFVD